MIAFSNYSFRPKELTFYGLGEFDLSRIASQGSTSFYINSSRGVFDITIGILPFQNEIFKDNKRLLISLDQFMRISFYDRIIWEYNFINHEKTNKIIGIKLNIHGN